MGVEWHIKSWRVPSFTRCCWCWWWCPAAARRNSVLPISTSLAEGFSHPWGCCKPPELESPGLPCMGLAVADLSTLLHITFHVLTKLPALGDFNSCWGCLLYLISADWAYGAGDKFTVVIKHTLGLIIKFNCSSLSSYWSSPYPLISCYGERFATCFPQCQCKTRCGLSPVHANPEGSSEVLEERGNSSLWAFSAGISGCKQAVGMLRFGYCRIIEWFGLEGTFKDHLVQPPCNEQGQRIRMIWVGRMLEEDKLLYLFGEYQLPGKNGVGSTCNRSLESRKTVKCLNELISTWQQNFQRRQGHY